MAYPTQISLSTTADNKPPSSHVRYVAFLLASGLVNALIAAILLVHIPDSRTPTVPSLTLRAVIFVLIGVLAGTSGPWFYWRRANSPFLLNPPIPFLQFAICCAVGWVWVPAVVLLSREDSPLTAPVALLGATLLAFALRRALPATPSPPSIPRQLLFEEILTRPQRQFHGYIAAVCIYLAAYELAIGWTLTACALLAASAFLIAWKLTQPPQNPSPTRRAAGRLALIALPAILLTFYTLIHGIAHRAQLEAVAAASRANLRVHGSNATEDTPTAPSATGVAGYHSIILWPDPPKHDLVPPIPAQTNLLAPGTTKPLIIKFDGPYFYFQTPNKRPGPNALQVHGTPLAHDFQSNNFLPLVMEGHQLLGTPIPIDRCGEIQLGILNGDNHPGPIAIALLLTDSASPTNQLYLGSQPVITSQSDHFAMKAAPAPEVLRYTVPGTAKIRRFDQITVMVLPDSSNYDQGSKIAIQQFQLIPR